MPDRMPGKFNHYHIEKQSLATKKMSLRPVFMPVKMPGK
jgi:hypothetical protein